MAYIKNALSSLLGEDSSWSWAEHLRPASFRGVPFGVMSGESVFGRRVAVHEYPYRDQAWVEDLGRSTRRITIKGFLIQESLIYDAPDVFTQRDNLIAACEAGSVGTLIHPTLGDLTVNITESGLRVSESAENGRVFEFELVVIESGLKVFAITQAEKTGALTTKNWLRVASTTAAKYIALVKWEMRTVTQMMRTIKQTADFWVNMANGVLNEATNLSDALSDTFGPQQYGRYQKGILGGSVSGATGRRSYSNQSAEDAELVKKQLIATTIDREKTELAISEITATDNVEAFCNAVQQAIQQIMAMSGSLERKLSILSRLSAFRNEDYQQSSESAYITQLTEMYFIVLTASAVAVLAAQSAPTSSKQAATQQADTSQILDIAMTTVGDLGLDEIYLLTQELRESVITFFVQMGAEKGRLTQYALPSTLSALHVSNRLYQDAARSDELIMEIAPRHPAFMPTRFKALKK